MLKGILYKKHDKVTCQDNCKQNGKIFGQTPYQCQYYSGDLRYDNLLDHQELPNTDTDDATTSLVSNPSILKFFAQVVQLEDANSDLEIRVRKQEDVGEQEQLLGEL